jgi:UDP-3-O-[3-hydroxymyristoyl] glucosamine N-acyltransferase
MKITIEQLARQLGAELRGNADEISRQIAAVSPVKAAGKSELTFVSNDKHKTSLSQSNAGAAIVSVHIEGFDKPQLIVKNVDAALIEALRILAPDLKKATEGIDSTAKVADNAKIAKGVSVGANVVIEDRVEIGQNSIISNGCIIGENSKLGENSRLDANVVVYHNCSIGNNVIIQANSTIGSTGFGYSFIDGAHRLIPHNGGVIIEDFVEIGANCCVDRAKFGNTIIGAGTKIDNLVQIAHNVVTGKCCLIVGQAGVAGSCKLGNGVVLGGQVGLADNIEIGDGTMIAARSGVMSSVPAGQKLAWTPAIKREDAFRTIGLVLRLPKMAQQLKQLSKRIEKLEAAEDDKS